MTARPLPLALLAAASLAASVARADRTLVYRYEIAGSNVGESRTVLRDDGTFSGSSTLDIGQKIAFVFSGKTQGPLVPEWTLDATVGKNVSKTVVAAGKATLSAGGKSRDLPDALLAPKFAALAPFFNRALLAGLPAVVSPDAPPLKPFDAFIVDGLSRAPATLLARSVKTVAGGPVRLARLKVASTELTAAWDESGECVGIEIPGQSFRILSPGYESVFASPLDAYPELSPATDDVTRATVRVGMRDGVALAGELLRPKREGKFPTILVRTPYGRASQTLAYGWLARRGYVVLVEDCRGRGESGGEWDPFVNEAADGDDSLRWIAAQPWSDGGAGMIGGSYGGYVQWAAASTGNPVLRCIVPQVSPPGSALTNLPYLYGAPLLLSSLWWLRIVEGKDADLMQYAKGIPGAAGLTTLPLKDVDEAVFGHEMPLWDRWISRDRASAWPGWNFQREIGATTLPALHISGYWDGDEIGTMLNWQARREAGHDAQWLVYGPWPHGFNASTTFGGIDFGKDSVLELDSVYLRFFDTYLKGKSVGWERTPRVKAFLTGANRWLEAAAWPLPESRPDALYLAGGGRLLEKPAPGRPDAWTYDPAKASVPKELTGERLDLDGALTVKRTSLKGGLVYRTEPLKSSLRVAGPISLDASLSTSAKDTDLIAALYDEAPDGTLRTLGQGGALRASYAAAPLASGVPAPLVPNRVYALSVRLWDFAHEFAPGHRLLLHVTSDGFPMYARNLGLAEPPATATRMVVQRNALYHDAARVSALRFRRLP